MWSVVAYLNGVPDMTVQDQTEMTGNGSDAAHGIVTLTRLVCNFVQLSYIKRRLPHLSMPRMLRADGSGL